MLIVKYIERMSKNQTEKSNQSNKTEQDQPNIITCDKFDPKKFTVEEPQLDSKYNKEKKNSQIISFARYDYDDGTKSSLYFETGEIRFTQYGIKNIDDNYIKSDKDRGYFRVPYDKSQPACVELFAMLAAIDII